jgi:hypothetical protein
MPEAVFGLSSLTVSLFSTTPLDSVSGHHLSGLSLLPSPSPPLPSLESPPSFTIVVGRGS